MAWPCFKFKKYIKKLDTRSNRAGNLILHKHYDKKTGGYRLLTFDDINDTEISEWCKETKLPDYIYINRIEEVDTSICQINRIKKAGIPIKITLPNVDEISNDKLTSKNKLLLLSQICQYLPLGFNEKNLVNKRLVGEYNPKYEILNIQKYIEEQKPKQPDKNCKNLNDYNLLIVTNDIPEFKCKKGDCFITYYTNEYNIINKNNVLANPLYENNIFITNGDKVKYSILKEEYKKTNTHGYTNEDGDNFIEDDNKFPEKYYWKTPDGWLYLYDKDKPEIISLDIVAPLPVKNVIQSNISIEPLINSDILLFANSCCKKTDKLNLRFGLKDIFKIYETWCKINGKKCLKTQKKFKEEFEKINYKEETSKGIDVNNKPGKRGYNIMVSL